MIDIVHKCSLSGARATRDELRAFLTATADKMSGEAPCDTATQSYVILRGLLKQLDGEIRLKEAANDAERRAAVRSSAVPIRQSLRFRR